MRWFDRFVDSVVTMCALCRHTVAVQLTYGCDIGRSADRRSRVCRSWGNRALGDRQCEIAISIKRDRETGREGEKEIKRDRETGREGEKEIKRQEKGV